MKSAEALDKEMSQGERLFKDHGLDATQMGRPESLRYNVLSLTIEESFDKAIKLLDQFLHADSPYPDLNFKIEKYIQHCKDVVNAIKIKRSFPGISSLTRAKQQELREKYREHFQELHFALTRIEKIQSDLRVNDAKATIWVVRSFWYAVLSIFFVALMLTLSHGTADTISLVVDDALDQMLNSIVMK